MMKHSLIAASLALALSSHFAVAAPVVFKEPTAVVLTRADGQAQTKAMVRSAIVAGASSLGWQVIAETPEKLTLKYSKGGKIELTLDASYDEKGYQLKYVSSLNLDYGMRNGEMTIHRTYERWVINLQKHILMAQMVTPAQPTVAN
ncbi:hypothetical protein [Chitinimonas prasina]|nr:hypothetical protein [Chitinimonas prasina]